MFHACFAFQRKDYPMHAILVGDPPSLRVKQQILERASIGIGNPRDNDAAYIGDKIRMQHASLFGSALFHKPTLFISRSLLKDAAIPNIKR